MPLSRPFAFHTLYLDALPPFSYTAFLTSRLPIQSSHLTLFLSPTPYPFTLNHSLPTPPPSPQEHMREVMGFVPQDDIVHEDLSVRWG